MNVRVPGLFALVACLCVVPSVSSAQVIKSDARVVYGHHHLKVTDMAAHEKFWVQGLGATVGPKKIGPLGVLHLHNSVILLQPTPPTAGGTKGTTVGHIGVEVPDIRVAVARLRSLGYQLVTSREVSGEVKDDVFTTGTSTIAFVLGPEDTLVELVENKSATVTGNHHLHIATNASEDMKAWYAKHFGAKNVMRGPREVQEIPGVILMYTPTKDAPATTKDHVLDHIGFEVKQLEAFSNELQAAGVKVDAPYSTALGVGFVFLTDPWGTVIELTEGLAQY